MEFFNFSASVAFLTFVLSIMIFGAKERTLVRAASFAFLVWFVANLIRSL